MRHGRIAVFLLTALFGAAACDPGVSRPGAWLSGEEVTAPVTDWTFTNAFEDCYLETATWYGIPHSVTLWCAVHDGDLHVGSFSAGGGWEGHRTWENHVARNGEGAARIDGRIYRGTWERVEDPGVIEAVERSYAAKYGHTETWKQGLATYDPLPEWRFYRLSQEAAPPEEPASHTVTFQGREVPRSEEAILDPKHTVLVVHEMLNDFVSKGGVADQVGQRYAMDAEVERIARLLAAARAKNVRVAYVRWTRDAYGATDDDASCARETPVCSGRRTEAGRAHPPSNIEGSWGWQAPEAIKPAPGDWVLPKWRQDAFFSTPLDALMRWNGIRTMVIVGLGAEVGIMPTVLTAAEMGYFPVVVEDAIAAAYPGRGEDAMEFLRDSAIIKNTQEMEEIWTKAAAAPTAVDSATGGEPPLNNAAPRMAAPNSTVDHREQQIPHTDADVLDPQHTLLLVHEMQNDFIGKGGAFDRSGRRIDADEILQPIAGLLAQARAKNVPVAYVRWTNYSDRSTVSDRMLRGPLARPGAVGGAWAVEATPGWEIADAVEPVPGDWLIRKYRPDAFFATPLDSMMRWNGIRTLVVVGVGAEVGVLPTLMTASNLGYFTVAVSDGLRPADPERMEDAMRYIADQAMVKTHAELLEVWRAAAPRPAE